MISSYNNLECFVYCYGCGKMTSKMDLKHVLFILAIIFLPVTHFRIDMPLIGTALSKFFILAGIILSVLKLTVGNLKSTRFERFAFFYLLVFLLWQCLCTVIGIQDFDYYDLVSLDQMDKLRYFIQTLRYNGIPVTDIVAIKVWLCLRFLKDCLLYVIFSYGVSLWVYHLYQDKDRCFKGSRSLAISHFTIAITVLCLIMTVYSIIEVGYLTGNLTCARILSQINPLLYEVKKLHGWWPPLLWKNQLRSLFAEPSFFGLASTMIVPVLIYKILDFQKNVLKKRFFTCVFGIFVVMLFLTRARTALLLFIGQLVLFILYVLFFNRDYFKKVFRILVIVLLSFGVSLSIMSSFRVVNLDSGKAYTANVQATAAYYISDNVASVVGNKRSNSARFASVRATFLTGLQHPLFGVGMGLNTAYVNANFTEEDLRNNEVRNWSRYIEREGVLKSPIPVLNQFSVVLANFGLVGLLLYLMPVFYVLFGILRVLKHEPTLEFACLCIAYIATVAAMLSNSAFLTYYIMTGVLISYIHMNNRRDSNYE